MTGIGDQNVLRLEIPMVYSKAVAMFRGIQNLEEDAPDQGIMTYISTTLGNI